MPQCLHKWRYALHGCLPNDTAQPPISLSCLPFFLPFQQLLFLFWSFLLMSRSLHLLSCRLPLQGWDPNLRADSPGWQSVHREVEHVPEGGHPSAGTLQTTVLTKSRMGPTKSLLINEVLPLKRLSTGGLLAPTWLNTFRISAWVTICVILGNKLYCKQDDLTLYNKQLLQCTLCRWTVGSLGLGVVALWAKRVERKLCFLNRHKHD